MSSSSSLKRTLVVAAAVLAAATTGCGADEPRSAAAAPEPTPAAKPVGKMVAGSVAQYADCGDWKQGTREEKLATIRDIRGQHTPQRSTTAASPYPDEKAYAMFEKTCSFEWAESLRLYKLYVKAQGYAPLTQ